MTSYALAMKVVAVIQARMSSTRLPGKVMLPLGNKHVLERDIERVSRSRTVDEVVVATSESKSDDIIARYADRNGAGVHRGSEEDVLDRMYEAAVDASADIVIRITGDCPLISPKCIDAVVSRLRQSDADYATNTLKQTLPRGLDVEAFTLDRFYEVEQAATDPAEREHVTLYFRQNPDRFDLVNVRSEEIFDSETLLGRSDLRLTLDEADDYELLRHIYEEIDPTNHLAIEDAVAFIDKRGLADINRNVDQKSPSESDTTDDSPFG